MPDYIAKTLHCFQHTMPLHPQNVLHCHEPIKCGTKAQTAPVDTSNPLSPEKIKQVQKIVGTLLYYSCAVDPTMVVALSSIAARQADGTEDVLLKCQQHLDYVASHLNATIFFLASNMVCTVHLDASYLSEFGGKGSAGGYYFLANKQMTSVMLSSSPFPPS